MTQRLNKFLNFFTSNNSTQSDFNYIKNKNLFLAIFGGIFATLLVGIVLMFGFLDSNISPNFKNKTTIEIPFKGEVDDDDLADIKDIACDVLQTECIIQKSEILDDVNDMQPEKLIINFFNDFEKEKYDDKMDDIVSNLVDRLQQDYGENLAIKNKEEVFAINKQFADVEDFNEAENLIVLAVVLLFFLLYYLFIYRKLNGLLVALSFLSAFIFQVVLVLTLFLAVVIFFNLGLNRLTIFPFAAILTFVLTNYILNFNGLFTSLKENMLKKESKFSFKEKTNFAINENFGTTITNFKILGFVPSFAGAVLSIIMQSYNILFFAAIYLISSIFCLLISNLFLASFWFTLKKKN